MLKTSGKFVYEYRYYCFFLIGLLLHLCTLVNVDNLCLTLKMHDMLKKVMYLQKVVASTHLSPYK